MRIATIFPILFTLFLSGCLTPETPEIPAWVESPPAATATELYGVSVADTPAQALVSAVGGIAASVYDAAEAQMEQLSNDVTMRKRILGKAKSILAELDYSTVIPKEKVALDAQTAILVAMPRTAMARQLSALLTQETKQMKAALENEADAPTLKRLGTLGKAYESRPGVLATIALVESVDPAAETSEARKLAERIEQEYNALKFGLGITVISDAQGIVFVDTLYKALRAEGIVPGGTKAGTVLVTTDVQRRHENGSYRMTMRVRLRCTADGKTVAQAQHFLESRAAESYKVAKMRAAKVLSNKIEENGLFHTLGF